MRRNLLSAPKWHQIQLWSRSDSHWSWAIPHIGWLTNIFGFHSPGCLLWGATAQSIHAASLSTTLGCCPSFGSLLERLRHQRSVFSYLLLLLTLSAYWDADWASCMDSRHSLIGFCVFLGPALVSWKTNKQSTVSRSSAEAEYQSRGSTVCELT